MIGGILRFVLGMLLGIVAMFVVITGVQFLGHRLYPPPPGLDPMRPDDLSVILAQQPVAALSFVVLAWALGAFAGGWVAARISRRWPRTAAIVVSLVVMLGVVEMIQQVPGHPQWLAILGLVLPIPMALLAARLARSRVVR